MEGNRRQYGEEFKKDAVGYSLTSEKTVVEVAQDPEECLSPFKGSKGIGTK